MLCLSVRDFEYRVGEFWMNIRVIFAVLIVLMLAGCGRPYKVRPLKSIDKSQAHFFKEKDDIQVAVRKLTRKEVGELFNGQMVRSTVTALMLSVKNGANAPIVLSCKQVGLNQLSADEVKSLLRHRTSPDESLVVLVPPLFLASVFLGSFVGCGLAVFLADIFIGVPAITYGLNFAAAANSDFDVCTEHDLAQKMLSRHIIMPCQTVSVLIFTKEFHQQFIITFNRDDLVTKFTIEFENSAHE